MKLNGGLPTAPSQGHCRSLFSCNSVSLIRNVFQTKSKAKKRYLKAKKERRKHRKTSDRSGALPEEETDDNSEDGPPEKTSTVISPARLARQSNLATGDDSQKRKKRKLDHTITEGPLEDQSKQAEVDEPEAVEDSLPDRALPLFPLPTRPDAPSKTELALQGLNRAQIEAELVDPNSTLPINLDADNSQSILGLKTRKRLIDLGVNDLFAGTPHSFPS
jgi:ATP-dependent RNA helicase DDX51/DBP6